MKKLILIVFALFVSITSFAQIQKKIFGCTLGTTTYQQVEKILESNYRNPWFDGSRTILEFDKIEYGGYYWSDVTFTFHKKVLYSVTFKGSNYTSTRNCPNDFTELESDLRKRYGQYENSEGYDDGTVVIKTSFYQKDKYQSATIVYEYKPFSKEKQKENENAW